MRAFRERSRGLATIALCPGRLGVSAPSCGRSSPNPRVLFWKGSLFPTGPLDMAEPSALRRQHTHTLSRPSRSSHDDEKQTLSRLADGFRRDRHHAHRQRQQGGRS